MLKSAVSRQPVCARAIAVLLCAGLGACSVHWPWRHRAPPAPQPVEELSIQPLGASAGAANAPILQFWDRNTLLIDLTAQSGEGAVTLRAMAGRPWPVRLEFRVQPGGIARLQVQGRERVVFEVPAQGAPTVLKLGPDVYAPDEAQIILRWSAAADSAR